MECKNCSRILSPEDKYCNDCGAKVITHRLTLRYLFTEFYHSFFSIDANKPLLTFVDMFKKPEAVIDGYIQGIRKKYIHAFGYFTIAVTISSIFYFFVLKFFPELYKSAINFQNNDEVQREFGEKIQNFVFEYQSFIFFALVPIFAFISWIIFKNKKKYNYAEHLVFNLYTYSQVSIVSILLYCFTLWNEELFAATLVSAIGILIVYYGYVAKRVFRLTFAQLCIKTLFFIALSIPIYIIVMLLVLVILSITGQLDGMIEAERSRHVVSYIASSAINWTS